MSITKIGQQQKLQLDLFRTIPNSTEADALHQDDGKLTAQQFTSQLVTGHLTHTTAEFKLLKTYKSPVATYYAFQENVGLNRYGDIKCMDQTRVVLGDGYGIDYINSNFVDGYKQKKAFICCQGPTAQTINDFWRMVWQEQVLVITMLTKVMEKNTEKCAQYWPFEESKQTETQNFVITNRGSVCGQLYNYSQLVVRNIKTDERRPINHLLFVAWPDFGIPKTVGNLVDFIRIARRCQRDSTKKYKIWKGHSKGPPIVVHCSAGVGRTGSPNGADKETGLTGVSIKGTMVATDICISSIVDCGKVDILETVKKIRSQRDSSVQKVEQYHLINLAVAEFIMAARRELGLQVGMDGTTGNEFEVVKVKAMAECAKTNDANEQ